MFYFKQKGHILISNDVDNIDKVFLKLYVIHKDKLSINEIKNMAKKEFYESLKCVY